MGPDELKANITAKPTDLEICVSKCKTDADCPTDTCPGTVAKPKCFLQDASGNKYCGLPCTPSGSNKCSSDEHMVCAFRQWWHLRLRFLSKPAIALFDLV